MRVIRAGMRKALILASLGCVNLLLGLRLLMDSYVLRDSYVLNSPFSDSSTVVVSVVGCGRV